MHFVVFYFLLTLTSLEPHSSYLQQPHVFVFFLKKSNLCCLCIPEYGGIQWTIVNVPRIIPLNKTVLSEVINC